jgi:hypothetical protein
MSNMFFNRRMKEEDARDAGDTTAVSTLKKLPAGGGGGIIPFEISSSKCGAFGPAAVS